MRKLLYLLLLIPTISFAQGTDNRQIERFPKGNVSLLASGSTLIGTTDNGTESFYPAFIVLAIQSSTITSLTLPSTISMGTNSPNYNNILPSTVLTGLYLVNQVISANLSGTIYTAVPANTGIYIKVTPLTGVGSSIALHATIYGDYHN